MRMAAKRAFSILLVPRRQLMVRHAVVSSIFSTGADFTSGT
jgi:hypothetical protein